MTEDEIIEALTDQLYDCLSSINAEHSIKGVVHINTETQEIAIKFKYHVVESDNYVGFGTY